MRRGRVDWGLGQGRSGGLGGKQEGETTETMPRLVGWLAKMWFLNLWAQEALDPRLNREALAFNCFHHEASGKFLATQ